MDHGNLKVFVATFRAKSAKMAKKMATLPTFKIKVATEKTSIYAGLRALWPFGHFFF